MGRIILLDTNVVGLLAGPGPKPGNTDSRAPCERWLRRQLADADVYIPDIVDYEIRREMTRKGATAQLSTLDRLLAATRPAAVTPDAWRKAAEFWALVRGRTSQTGQPRLPTAPDLALDGDAILAGVAAKIGGPGDIVLIASTNARHLTRFPGVAAEAWENIA